MQDYQGMAGWVRDMKQKEYAYVPIHDSYHWSLVIICHPEGHDSSDGRTPGLLHLDSLRDGRHNSEEIFSKVENLLWSTWGDELGGRNMGNRVELRKQRVSISEQKNNYDCGIFVLYSMQKFLQKAPQIFTEDMYSSHETMVSSPTF